VTRAPTASAASKSFHRSAPALSLLSTSSSGHRSSTTVGVGRGYKPLMDVGRELRRFLGEK